MNHFPQSETPTKACFPGRSDGVSMPDGRLESRRPEARPVELHDRCRFAGTVHLPRETSRSNFVLTDEERDKPSRPPCWSTSPDGFPVIVTNHAFSSSRPFVLCRNARAARRKRGAAMVMVIAAPITAAYLPGGRSRRFYGFLISRQSSPTPIPRIFRSMVAGRAGRRQPRFSVPFPSPRQWRRRIEPTSLYFQDRGAAGRRQAAGR